MIEASEHMSVRSNSAEQPLSEATQHALQRYLQQLDGAEPTQLYALFLEALEVPLLTAVLNYTNGNQVQAAKILGMSRGTLRKKIDQYLKKD